MLKKRGRKKTIERQNKIPFTLQIDKMYHLIIKEISQNVTSDMGRLINEAIGDWLINNNEKLQGYIFRPDNKKMFKKFLQENNDEEIR